MYNFLNKKACLFQVEDAETLMIFDLEHSFSASPNAVFKPRAVISVKSVRSGIANFLKEDKLDSDDIANLRVYTSLFYNVNINLN